MAKVERAYGACLSARARLHVLMAYVSGDQRQILIKKLRAIATGWRSTYEDLPCSLIFAGWLNEKRRPTGVSDDMFETMLVKDLRGEVILGSLY